ncbi:MAG: isoprenylcysteine carboxylmethyltransferase family protein [Deltaproteobacteria bacterium]|nr:isoprenylcysteine carboxylmethyltransferase family protein [Deltaproteobacteria bacterium]
MQDGWQKLTWLLFKYRIRLTFLIFILLLGYESWHGLSPRRPFDPSDPLGLLGGIMALAGALIRTWSAGVIHKNDRLATTGPYALCRHPLYLGSLTMALGFMILLNEPLNFLALGVLILLVYVPKIRAEEALLSDLYPEAWTVYTRTTGLLFPKSLPTEVSIPWSRKQWTRNREHHGLLFAVLLLAILIWAAWTA